MLRFLFLCKFLIESEKENNNNKWVKKIIYFSMPYNKQQIIIPSPKEIIIKLQHKNIYKIHIHIYNNIQHKQL